MRVLAAARSQPLLDELAAEVRTANGIIETVVADVTRPEDRQGMVDAAVRHFGGLDILINNAGIGATGHFMDSDPEILRKIFETNFFGTTETTRVFLPLLKQGVTPAIVEHLLGRRQAGVAGAVAITPPASSRWRASANRFAPSSPRTGST